MFSVSELVWALIGLILTIGSTWLEAFTFVPLFSWRNAANSGIDVASLGVTFQVGAALFTGCMGGRNAAALSQIAYVILGIALFEQYGLEVFAQGSGVGYLREPSFGYLLGFIPAGWLCGAIAHKAKPSIERLAFAALSGLALVHLCGLAYLVLGHLFRWLPTTPALGNAIMTYSLAQIPGQIMVSCAIALIAFGCRKALFY